MPCNTNTNGEYGGWRSSSKPAFSMAASAWADLWSDALSWLQVTSVFPYSERIHERTQNFLTKRTLSARYMADWKTKNNNSSTTGSELWRNAGPSAFQLQVSMLKSDKIWCVYLVLNCVSLRTFWTPLVHVYVGGDCGGGVDSGQSSSCRRGWRRC